VTGDKQEQRADQGILVNDAGNRKH